MEQELSKQELKQAVIEGKIFIYPTDTIYGIGCNALDEKAVNKIREIKHRDIKPFSVIAPSFDWINENLIVDTDLDLRKYLPGKYTLILKKKNPSFLSNVSSLETLGVRIPDNDFTKKIQKINLPFITTSVNFSGQPPANKISEISSEILNQVDYIIDAGELSGKPSSLVIDGKVLER
ncbi:threonylcarbamoyl-AMP synthase [Candidatus Pacearchaeota archaeon]|nr:threonylcarbamoyl-AMP synthase [Candidatus Pacearchaeota archaeon]